MPTLPLIERAAEHGEAIALQDGTRSYSYNELLERSKKIASSLLGTLDDLNEALV